MSEHRMRCPFSIICAAWLGRSRRWHGPRHWTHAHGETMNPITPHLDLLYRETPCSYSNVWKKKLTHQLLYSVADLQIQCTVHWTDLHMQQDGQFPTACLLFIPVHVDDEDYEGERLGSVDASKKYQISCWQIVRNKPTNKRITDISKEWKSTHIDRKSR